MQMSQVDTMVAVAVLFAVAVVAGWRMFAGRPGEPTAAATSTPIRSIAVLPLENLSGDPVHRGDTTVIDRDGNPHDALHAANHMPLWKAACWNRVHDVVQALKPAEARSMR